MSHGAFAVAIIHSPGTVSTLPECAVYQLGET
jgi:hypothetical protein